MLSFEQQNKHQSKLNRERIPTNTTTKYHPIHRWYNFIAGFSPEFVSECIDTLPLSRRGVLLDPFSGCGTAQVEGLKRGMTVIGYEAHPIFARIARAKTAFLPSSERLDEICGVIKEGLKIPCGAATLGDSPESFLLKLFAPETLSKLIGARNAILSGDLVKDDLAFLILSKVVEATSHSQTDGIYKAPTSRKKSIDPHKALEVILEIIRADIENISLHQIHSQTVQIHQKTCEDMNEVIDSSIDLIVTSPPYLNNFDYAEMTRMHLYFWGIAKNWGEITDHVRSKLIVNTTTALKGHKSLQANYRSELPIVLHNELDEIVAKLTVARQTKAGKKEYNYLIYPYFSQMQCVLRECQRVMSSGAHFHMMVADAALYGTHIPAPQIIANLMVEMGFKLVDIKKIRTRGKRWILEKREGSVLGLGEYHISALK